MKKDSLNKSWISIFCSHFFKMHSNDFLVSSRMWCQIIKRNLVIEFYSKDIFPWKCQCCKGYFPMLHLLVGFPNSSNFGYTLWTKWIFHCPFSLFFWIGMYLTNLVCSKYFSISFILYINVQPRKSVNDTWVCKVF